MGYKTRRASVDIAAVIIVELKAKAKHNRHLVGIDDLFVEDLVYISSMQAYPVNKKYRAVFVKELYNRINYLEKESSISVE